MNTDLHSAQAVLSDTIQTGQYTILGISVTGGFLDGVRMMFAEGLNRLIGARGTGKTTVLEFIRYALDLMPSDPSERRRLDSLIQSNLQGGQISLKLRTGDGVEYLARRCWNEPPSVVSTNGDSLGTNINLREIFRAAAFSQNEVETIADDLTSQLALIDSFQPQQLAEVQQEISNLQLSLRSSASQIVPLQHKIAAIEESLSQLPHIEQRLAQLAGDGGQHSNEVNQAHAAKSIRDRENRLFGSISDGFTKMQEQMTQLNSSIERHAKAIHSSDLGDGENGPLVRTAISGYVDFCHQLQEILQNATQQTAIQQGCHEDQLQQLTAKHGTQEELFHRLLQRHKEAQGQAVERSTLDKKRNALLENRREQQELIEQLESALASRAQMLHRLSELKTWRFSIRRTTVDHLNRALMPIVRITLKEQGDVGLYSELIERQLRKSRLMHRVVAQRIASTIGPDDLARIIRDKNKTALIDAAGLNSEQADKVLLATGEPDLLFELETIELVDLPKIELLDGEVYKESLTLSTGQKCTSVLPILLLDNDGVLMIDQPEDNLDNGFIYSTIVENIQRIKQHRQLFFVTHNPNIPVLGDAEQVFVLKSNGSSSGVDKFGTVDQCKDHIITLLEGGRDAFQKRHQRYQNICEEE